MRHTLATRYGLALFCMIAAYSCTLFGSGVHKKSEYIPPDDQAVGSFCKDQSWCREGLKCVDGKCEACECLTTDHKCVLTGECGAGLYCNSGRACAPAGNAAENQPCKTTADCVKGLICVLSNFSLVCKKTGKIDQGEACSSTSNCAAGLTCGINPASAGDAGAAETATVCYSARPTASELPLFPVWNGIECEDDKGSAKAYFEVPRKSRPAKDFYRLPFPNDIRRTSTGLDLSGHPEPDASLGVPYIARYWEAAEKDLTGFAVNPVVVFRFSKEANPGTLNAESVHIVNITPGSPTYDQELARRWQWNPNQTKYLCANALSIGTNIGSPLRPNTTYAVYITTDVLPKESGNYSRSNDLDALLGGAQPADAELASAYAAYAPLRAWLASSGKTSAQSILNAAVFTTQDPEAMLPKLRAAVQSSGMPAVSQLTRCGEGVTSPCDDGTELRKCGPTSADFAEIHGRISLPIFQQGTPPYEKPENGGGIALDASGIPKVARTENVCFALTVPAQAPPDGGYPLLIYGHGTGGSFTSAVSEGFARDLATASIGGSPAPAATLTIDMPQHGERRGGSKRPPEELFFNYANPRAARDNVLQGAADLMSLVFWAKSYNLAAAGSPTGNAIAFNPGRIVIFGHSQGAMHTSLMLPYEPDVAAAMLTGNGGYRTELLLLKTKLVDIAAALPYALLEPDSQNQLKGGSYHPMLAIFQMFFERSDPVNYAYRIEREPTTEAPSGHHLFMSYGLNDSYSPDETQKAFAVAADLPQVTPAFIDIGLTSVAPPAINNVTLNGVARTIGLKQYTPNAGEDGHFVVTSQGAPGRPDAFLFLSQALAGQSPQIGQ